MSKGFSRLSCCCVLGLSLGLGVAARGATSYYVDAAAKKGGNGAIKSPFATIQQAADVARAGDVVFIKPGTYCESVRPANSGKEGSPIVFRNCPGEERPTICAGDTVTGPWTLEGKGIYWAPCKWGMGLGRNQVVVDGDLMIEAREPNIAGEEQLADAYWLGRMLSCKVNKDDVVVSGAPKRGPDFWKGGVVWIAGGWAAKNAIVIKSQVAGADCKLSITNKTIDWWHEGGGECFLTGVKAALDHEKEFFLDEAAGRLYLMAPGAVDPSGLAVHVKKRLTVIDLTGLKYVVFDRVNTVMGGITLKRATRCAIRNGRHFYSSHFYLFAYGPGGNPLGTTDADPAASAVFVSGESNSVEGCEIAYAATGVRLDGRNQVIRNCTIRDIYGGNYFSNVFIAGMDPVGGEFGGHLIERNTIGRGSRGLVHWTTMTFPGKPSTYVKCRVQYNHFFDFNEFCNDGGATYAWHVNGGGTEVAYNWIHGDRGTYHFNPGLYADNDTSDFRYHHNVVWDVKLGIGWNQTSGRLEAYNNTIWGRTGSLKMTTPAGGCKTYNNLSNRSYKDAAARGNDLKNNLTAGGFVGNPDSPTSGLDFRLAANSPAVNAGVEIPGITDGAVGAPDVGAYEFGGKPWTAGAGTEPVPPAAPIEFSAAAVSAHGIKLAWTDEAHTETGYVLERSTDGKTWVSVTALAADAFSCVDAGFHLKAGTPYQYRLAATNKYGLSAYASVKASTLPVVKAPVITSPPAATAWEGLAFSYTIAASNDPGSVAATGLPKGLSLNPTTGVISGYPEEAGLVKVQLTATNAKGTGARTLALTIARPEPVAVTGGTVTEYVDAAGVRWTVLTFTNSGSFTVSGGPAEYLIVAGGGGGGDSGGGGAGGVVTGSVNVVKGEHKVVVGPGGAGTNGEPSSIIGPSITWTATGGGRGGNWHENGKDGGSGGGVGKDWAKGGGNALPPVTIATRQDSTLKQGNRGGDSAGYRGAGGGGAGGVGENGSSNRGPGPAGGAGLSSAIDGTTKWYAGGGGGGGSVLGNPGGPGGSSVGGNGSGADVAATDGRANTGGGGGAGGGKGGSGIVIIRYVRSGTASK